MNILEISEISAATLSLVPNMGLMAVRPPAIGGDLGGQGDGGALSETCAGITKNPCERTFSIPPSGARTGLFSVGRRKGPPPYNMGVRNSVDAF